MVVHNRFFLVWHDYQLRLHHAYEESEWEHVPEHPFQHQRLNYRHYLPFPNRCDQQRWDEDGPRQDLYYALALGALTAGLQKVSAGLEASKPAPQVVNTPWSRMGVWGIQTVDSNGRTNRTKVL